MPANKRSQVCNNGIAYWRAFVVFTIRWRNYVQHMQYMHVCSSLWVRETHTSVVQLGRVIFFSFPRTVWLFVSYRSGAQCDPTRQDSKCELNTLWSQMLLLLPIFYPYTINFIGLSVFHIAFIQPNVWQTIPWFTKNRRRRRRRIWSYCFKCFTATAVGSHSIVASVCWLPLNVVCLVTVASLYLMRA